MKHWRFALLFAIFFSCATLYAQTVPDCARAAQLSRSDL